MNIKEKIEEIVRKIQGDAGLQERFRSDPINAVEGLLGVDLPDDVVKQVTDGVAAALTAEKASGIVDKLKGLIS